MAHTLQPISLALKKADPLFQTRVRRLIPPEEIPLWGWVADIEASSESGELLYLIEYDDGDAEHLTQEEVTALIPSRLAQNEQMLGEPQPETPKVKPAGTARRTAARRDTSRSAMKSPMSKCKGTTSRPKVASPRAYLPKISGTTVKGRQKGTTKKAKKGNLT